MNNDCRVCQGKGYVKVGNDIASVYENCPECNRDACNVCHGRDDKECNKCES